MQTTKITDNSHLFYKDIYKLYHDSFPMKERRKWADMEQILKTDKRFNMFVFSIDNEFIGFLTCWKFGSFVYVEHFAIENKKRGKGIGSQIMQSFIGEQNLPIILEVELPETTVAIRRIAFYEKLDFSVISKTYLQPPYDRKSDFLPLLLMTNDSDFGNKHFNEVRKTLYNEVYKA